MRSQWLRLGCFLLGYNYSILRSCSEVSVQKVIRLTSAMLLICILWAFIGFSFAERYLGASVLGSVGASVLMILLVIQIERQVILSRTDNRLPLIFRTIIAVLMAIIGSAIVDQIIFKDDIDKQKTFSLGKSVNEILPERTLDHRKQIEEIEKTILSREQERAQIVQDISKSPKITMYNRERVRSKDAQDSLQTETVKTTTSEQPNPKIDLLMPLDEQLRLLRKEKFKKDSILLGLRPAVEAELRDNHGFLDEIGVMTEIFSKSTTAVVVWGIWFILLLGVELFIVVNKWKDSECDYDKVIQLQMSLHMHRIELLKNQTL